MSVNRLVEINNRLEAMVAENGYTISDLVEDILSLSQDIKAMIAVESASKQCASCSNGNGERHDICPECRNWSGDFSKPLLWKHNNYIEM